MIVMMVVVVMVMARVVAVGGLALDPHLAFAAAAYAAHDHVSLSFPASSWPAGAPKRLGFIPYPSAGTDPRSKRSRMAPSWKATKSSCLPGVATQWPKGESKTLSSASRSMETSMALSSGGK